jgi:hypothetical protein
MHAPQSALSLLAVATALLLSACASRQPEVPTPEDERTAAIAKVLALGEAAEAAQKANEAAQNAPYDPVAFQAKLQEARKPYDKCIDDKIPEYKTKQIADKTLAVILLLNDCNSAFRPVGELIDASPVAKMPDEKEKVMDSVVGAARRRANAAFGAS